jgi:hypothetical protein
VVVAEFEEKTYEIAYCVELAVAVGSRSVVYSPGQVLESILGFDAASHPDPRHAIWAILGLPRPRGVQLIPSLWGAAKALQPPNAVLPSYPVSIFLQFKRPEYLHGAAAKQWNMWRRPYFRFERTRRQQQVLGRLERRLGTQAVVRYAAPAFHTMGEFEAAQLAGSVIARSGHVPPSRLRRHQCWTYDAPGNLGRPNPTGEPFVFERFDALLEDVLARSVSGSELQTYSDEPLSVLQQHLRSVAAVCRDREPELRQEVDLWTRQLGAVELSSETTESLRDFASIQWLMAKTNGTWWVAGV